MTQQQLDAALSKLGDLEDLYRTIESTPIPDSIRDGIKDKWELAVDAMEVSVTLAYLPEDRHRDRQRLVRFGDVIQLLQEMESELVEKLVKDEADLIFAKVRRGVAAVKWLGANWTNLGEILHVIWEFIESTYAFFAAAIPFLVSHVLAALAIPAFTIFAVKALKVRDGYPDRMRKLALPQRRVKRVYRRKISRL